MVELKKQGDKLWHERNEHLSENPLNDYVQRPKNTNTTEELLRSMTLKPTAPDDVKVAFKVIREYTNAIKKLDDEVDAIKKRIIKSE